LSWLDGIGTSLDNPTAMDIDAYLQRINYSGSRVPSVDTLRQLHRAHLRTVPFENLSIHANEPIVLNDTALFRKIVENRRGGFCYELNGLFAALLRALGFKVEMLAAGVAKGNAESGVVEYGPIFDHMTLIVTLEERWLADVGFGDSFVLPLRLDDTREQIEGNQTYRILENDSQRILWRRNGNEVWQPQYRFTLDPYNFPDYEEMCHFHQTSPESHFTRNRICSRATEDGRITLSGMRLITTNEAHREEVTLESQAEYDRILRELFGIALN
jgi:N-hydroxyarylamine O-acetyltransferase